MNPPFSRTAYDLLREQARMYGERAAVIAGGVTTSYAALADRAARVAGRLAADGIRRGDRVGLLCNNRVEWLEVLFGASALGAVVVPFSTWSKASELDFLLSDSKVRCLFLISAYGGQNFAADVAALAKDGRHDALKRVVLIDKEAPPLDGLPDPTPYETFTSSAPLGELPPGAGASAADTLVVLYTSGSSNRPKAVPLAHYAAIENGFNIGERQGLTPDDRVLVAVPLFWSYGAVNAMPATLTHGGTLVLQGRFEPGEALDLIEAHRCTAIYTLPAMTNALTTHPQFNKSRTSSLRTGVTIGAPQDLLNAAEGLGAAGICNIYGSTETYGNCCVSPTTWSLEKRAKFQGLPLPGVTMRVRNPDTGELCAPGEVGTVEVSGYLMAGYAGSSAQHNEEVLTPDAYFRTGDLGSLSEDGVFSFAGRSSEIIKRSGINVSPAEVEEVLQQHPDVGLAGVTGAVDALKGELIIAFVVPRAGRTIDRDGLLAHCRDRLSAYKRPDRLEVVQALPLTPTGKLMRRELKAMAIGGASEPVTSKNA